MAEIIKILNTILRLLQIIIILGSVAIFIYLGILFYFKKYDEVKKNLPYVFLGLALLISVYSIPVIILSFLEKNTSYQISFNNFSNNLNSDINSDNSKVVNCQIIGSLDSFLILNHLTAQPKRDSCELNLQLTTATNSAFVICQYGNDDQNKENCWGIYGEVYDANKREIIRGSGLSFSALGMNLRNLNETKRLLRLPSSDSYIYCAALGLNQTITVPVSDKNYIFVIFYVEPNTSTCPGFSGVTNKVSARYWTRRAADIFGLVATTSSSR